VAASAEPHIGSLIDARCRQFGDPGSGQPATAAGGTAPPDGAAEHRRARRTLRLARPFRVLHHCSSRARLIGATLHPDGRTLTFHFIGADPSFEEYPRAEVVESAQALTVVPIARDIGPPGFRHLVGHPA